MFQGTSNGGRQFLRNRRSNRHVYHCMANLTVYLLKVSDSRRVDRHLRYPGTLRSLRSLPLHLNFAVCSWYTSVLVHTLRIIPLDLATGSLRNLDVISKRARNEWPGQGGGCGECVNGYSGTVRADRRGASGVGPRHRSPGLGFRVQGLGLRA